VVGYFFNPKIYLQSWCSSRTRRQLVDEPALGWLTTAGTGLFVVYNQAHGVDLADRSAQPLAHRQVSRHSPSWAVERPAPDLRRYDAIRGATLRAGGAARTLAASAVRAGGARRIRAQAVAGFDRFWRELRLDLL
jgi:hypothetical protein